jgi:hypothetical protein
LKQALTRAFAFLEGALVELLHQFTDGLVQFTEREELAVPQLGTRRRSSFEQVLQLRYCVD